MISIYDNFGHKIYRKIDEYEVWCKRNYNFDLICIWDSEGYEHFFNSYSSKL